MRPFDFVRPATVRKLRGRAGAGLRLFAGGTNLVDLMKRGVSRPEQLVDISHLPSSTASRTFPTAACGSARWSAMQTSLTTATRPTLSSRRRGAVSGASAQLRNAATVGGNLLQRTRCALLLRRCQRLQQTRPRHRL